MKTKLRPSSNPLPPQGRLGRSRTLAAFTIAEVVVAAFIAAIAFAAIFSAISNGTTLLQNTRENLRATQIIQSRIEGLRLIAWGNSTNQLFNNTYFPTNFTDTYYPLGLAGTTNSGAIYYGTITFENPAPLNTSYNSNMAYVTITLKWTNNASGNVIPHSRTFSTYVARYGLQNYVYYATNNF